MSARSKSSKALKHFAPQPNYGLCASQSTSGIIRIYKCDHYSKTQKHSEMITEKDHFPIGIWFTKQICLHKHSSVMEK